MSSLSLSLHVQRCGHATEGSICPQRPVEEHCEMLTTTLRDHKIAQGKGTSLEAITLHFVANVLHLNTLGEQ